MIEDQRFSIVSKPGTFNPAVPSPLRHIVTYENVVPGKPIDLALKYDEAQMPNVVQAILNENKDKKILTVTPNKQGKLASQKAEHRKISDSSNQDEVFFELSPELPTINPASATFGITEYDIFEYEQVSEFQESLNYEFRNLVLDDSVVDVAIKPMGRPLAPKSHPLHLDLLTLPETLVKNVAPFCGVIDQNTWAILNILEYEIRSIDDSNPKENRQGLWNRLKIYFFGYKDEDSYFQRYPWAKFVIRANERNSIEDSD